MFNVFILFQAKYYDENKFTHIFIGGIMFVVTMFVWLYEELSTFRLLTKVYHSKHN